MSLRVFRLFSFAVLGAVLPLSLAAQSSSSSLGTTTQTRSESPCGPAGCIVSNDSTASAAATAAPQPTPTQVPTTAAARTGATRSNIDAPSDFQKFVADTTGQNLPVFGQDLFLNTPADFLPATSVAAPADYVLGTGDQIKIRTSGTVSMDVSTTVDRNGNIYIPQVGTVPVAGLRSDQLQSTLSQALHKQFQSFDLSVTLGELRSIQIFVLGQARRPGVYTVSSLSTLVNALFTSGGPSNAGSMRNIELKRGDETITHFDVYDLLLHGDKSHDVHLQPGDIIYIPTVGPQMAVLGEVNTPAIYELKGPTTAAEVLTLAGGLTPVAGTARASLDRVVDHDHRDVQDFPLNGADKLIQVQGGDILRVFPVTSKIEKAVTLRGYVGQPGRYPWHEGMRVSDLIPSRQFLLTRAYYNQQNALAPNVQSNPFAPGSGGATGTRTTALTSAQAAAAGSTPDVLKNSTDTNLAPHETEIDWTYAAIERLGPTDLTTHILSFNLGEAIDDPSSSANKLLEPGDVVVVYSVNDINLPVELRARFVRIDGEVAKPGVYRLEGDETLRDLVSRAGGLAPHAYPYALQLTRESVRIEQELKLQALLQRETQAVLSPFNAPPLSTTGTATADLDLRKAYLQALAQEHASGRVVLQLAPDTATVSQLPAFALVDGDHVFVPARPDTVDVIGNVNNQGALRYVIGKRVGDYLDAAGGDTREADGKRAFVIRADGTVVSHAHAYSFKGLRMYPGDSIVVPGKFKPGFSLLDAINLTQFGSTLAITAAALSTLR